MNFMLRAKDTGKVNIDRIFARLLVALGGVFWIAALFGGNVKANYEQFVYTLPELAKASTLSLVPLGIVIVVFALGWFYERLTGLVLLAVAAVMLLWGIVAHGSELAADTVLWTTAVVVLVAPAAFAGVLYLLAARTQEVQELSAPAETS
jgi:hypothetical protein